MALEILNDRYEIIWPLESNSLGETFLAEDSQVTPARQCKIASLKPIAKDLKSYQIVKQRFREEVSLLKKIGDEISQVPCIYSYFELEEKFYLVEEWIAGQTLSSKVQQEGLWSEEQVLDLLWKVLPVLDYIHSHETVHLDIHPDNIILCAEDDTPVLVNFGRLKEAMAMKLSFSGSSTCSVMVGTPGFMASEQATGRTTYASDLYSLGLTAVFLLTGKIPQELENDPVSGEFIWHHYLPQGSSRLVNVINKAIKINHRDRFSTAQEMLQALKAVASTPSPLNFPQRRLPLLQESLAPVVEAVTPTTTTATGMIPWYKIVIAASLVAAVGFFSWAVARSLGPFPDNGQQESSLPTSPEERLY